MKILCSESVEASLTEEPWEITEKLQYDYVGGWVGDKWTTMKKKMYWREFSICKEWEEKAVFRLYIGIIS